MDLDMTQMLVGILVLVIVLPIVVLPYWQIFRKAGFSPVLSLLILVPLVNLVLLYYVAFSHWKVGQIETTASTR